MTASAVVTDPVQPITIAVGEIGTLYYGAVDLPPLQRIELIIQLDRALVEFLAVHPVGMFAGCDASTTDLGGQSWVQDGKTWVMEAQLRFVCPAPVSGSGVAFGLDVRGKAPGHSNTAWIQCRVDGVPYPCRMRTNMVDVIQGAN